MRLLIPSLLFLFAFAAACGDDPRDGPAAETAADSPEAVAQLVRAWAADIRSLELEIDVEVRLFGAPTRFGMSVAADGADSHAVVTTPDSAQAEGGRTQLEVLTRGGRTFTLEASETEWSEVDSEQFWLAGISVELLTGAAAFDWSPLDGVMITAGEHNAAEVWIVEYVFELSDLDTEAQGIGVALGPAAALLLRSFDLPTELLGEIEVRTIVARDSGAPLLSEVAVALNAAAGVQRDRAVTAATTLTAWNQPVQLPEINAAPANSP